MLSLATDLAQRLGCVLGTETAVSLVRASWPEICCASGTSHRRVLLRFSATGVPFLTAQIDEPASFSFTSAQLPASFEQLPDVQAYLLGRIDERPPEALVGSPPVGSENFLTSGPYFLRLRVVLEALEQHQPDPMATYFTTYLLNPPPIDAKRAYRQLSNFAPETDTCDSHTVIGYALACVWRERYGSLPVHVSETELAIAADENNHSRLSTFAKAVPLCQDFKSAYNQLYAGAWKKQESP